MQSQARTCNVSSTINISLSVRKTLNRISVTFASCTNSHSKDLESEVDSILTPDLIADLLKPEPKNECSVHEGDTMEKTSLRNSATGLQEHIVISGIYEVHFEDFYSK